MSRSLFDYLIEQVGCQYLSDLHCEEYRGQILFFLSAAPKGQFPIEEWNDLVQYLIQENRSFSSEREALNFLKSRSRGM